MMRRKLAFLAALVLLPMSMGVQALGLGNIKLSSALNQPLNAEIPLLSISQDEAENLFVGLAPSAAFVRAGIERPFFLSQLKFKIGRDSRGVPLIRVTTREEIREPFISFLVEVEWPKGRLLREYTMLLDPPTYADQTSSAPAIEAPSTLQITGGDEPYQPQPQFQEQVVGTQLTMQPAPAVQAQARLVPKIEGGNYGPTKRNDTLWRIAEQVRPSEGVSVEQTMMGLFRENPQAFMDGNINRLRAGHVLRIPTQAEAAVLTQAAALNKVRTHTRAWRDYKNRRSQSAGRTPVGATAVSGGETASEPRLKLVTPAEDGEGESATARAGGAGESGDMSVLRQELSMANETNEAVRLENQQLKSRLDELQDQLNSLQRMLALQNQDLAALQAGAEASAGQPEREAMPVVEPVEEVTAAEDQPAATDVEQPDVATPLTDEEQQVMAEAEQADATQALEVAQSVEAEQQVTESAPQEMEPTDEEGLVDGLLAALMGDTYMMAGGAAGLLLLVVALALVMRRRRMAADEEAVEFDLEGEIGEGGGFDDSLLEGTDEELEQTLVDDDVEQELSNEDEAGPLAEADVYIAYGKYAEAEELMRKAIDDEPAREDFRVKLLEILHANQDSSGFDAQAEELHSIVSSESSSAWKQVARMGRDLSADNELYSEGLTDSTGSDTGEFEAAPDFDFDAPMGVDEATDEPPLDLDFELPIDGVDEAPAEDGDDSGLAFDLSGFGEEEETKSTASTDDGGLEFDLGDGDKSLETEGASAKTASDTGLEFNFDMNEGDSAEGDGDTIITESPAAEETSAAVGDLGLNLEFDESLADEETAAMEKVEIIGVDVDTSQEDAEEFNFDLDDGEAIAIEEPAGSGEDVDLNFSSTDQSSAEGELDLTLATIKGEVKEVEGKGFNIEWDVTGLGEEGAAALEADQAVDEVGVDMANETGDVSELSGDEGDMVNTKLDLAKAYIEMDDEEGARSILDEVLDEGDEEQKSQAQELIAKIGS